MRVSGLFGKTQREIPSEAETESHRLLLRAGLIAQLAAGVYSYLPLAWRVLKKIEAIIREEMDLAGGQELHMPVLQPLEIWQKSGRDRAFGAGLFTLYDRRKRQLALGPTHEEALPDTNQIPRRAAPARRADTGARVHHERHVLIRPG